MAMKNFTIPSEAYTRFKEFHELIAIKIQEILLYIHTR